MTKVMDSVESKNKEVDTEPFIINSSQQRKRSKVSRACDSCRRKKIKCNADYSSSLNEVTKKCDNCVKNQEECLFSRTPLKRGPSKGYIRDLEEKLEISNTTKGHIILPPIIKTTSSDSLTGTNGTSNIVTPSMGGSNLNPGTKILNMNPSSPSISDSHSPKIQGPFWKVPYEMPHRNDINHDLSRRSSIDSISSNSTNNSRNSRLPSLKPSISSDQNSVSDSDDDYYSTASFKQSRRSSASLSPRNSISSLSSLNGRIKKVTINQSPVPTSPAINQSPSISQPQPHSQLSLPNINSIAPPLMPNLKVNNQMPPLHMGPQYNTTRLSLNENLKAYYTKFHLNFPILPFNETYIHQIMEIYNNSPNDHIRLILDMFNQSLANLINYQNLNLNDTIQLIYKVISIYPFNNYGIQLNDNFLVLFFSSLVLTNYAILLSSNTYSLGISLTHSILNDFKVLENFRNLLETKEINELYFDNIKLVLPKLYYCTLIIDNCYSLSFGIQKAIPGDFRILYDNVNYLVPMNLNTDNNFDGFALFKNVDIIVNLLAVRDGNIFGSHPAQIPTINCNSNGKDDTILNHFTNIVRAKYELFSFFKEITRLLNNNVNDELVEILNDYIFKLLRLIKTLSGILWKFSSFIAGLVNKVPIICPVLNLIIFQSLKLMKLAKLNIDTLANYVKGETFERIIKINDDLANAFNILNNSLPNCLLSVNATQLVKLKLMTYNFQFSNLPNMPISNSLLNWKFDFFKVILPFVEREDTDGWL